MAKKRELHLMLSLRGLGFLPGSWRHPQANPALANQPTFYTQLAQTAERGLFDLIYLDESHSNIQNEPELRFDGMMLASLLFASTQRIGIGAPIATNVLDPFHAARTLTVLDYFSEGRAAWHPSLSDHAELNRPYLRSAGVAEDELPTRKAEFVTAVQKLWESWEEGALLVDRENGRFFDNSKVHRINHEGPYFQVRGPLPLPRPIQTHPVQVEFETYTGSDIVVLDTTELEQAKEIRAAIFEQSTGSNPSLVFTSVIPVLADSEQEAQDKLSQFRELAGTIPTEVEKNLFVGTPQQLADWIISWHEAGVTDGIHLQPALLPFDLELFVDQVVPLLQQAGIYRTTYENTTLRGHLGLGKPEAVFKEGVQ